MPTFTVGEDVQPLDEGQYNAKIISIEPAPIDPNSRFDKAQSIVTWELEVEDDQGAPIQGFTRRQYVNDVQSLTPKSTWYGLFSALLAGGQPLEKGVEYNTEQLIGRPGLIFWGSYVGEDGTTKMKILKVSPPKRQAPQVGSIRRRATPEEANAI
jgi:hypothetical protein